MERTIEIEEKIFIPLVIPCLPKEALKKLPAYCPRPAKDNLATQYYFWNLDLQKEMRKLKEIIKGLEEKIESLSGENQRLKEENDHLRIEKEKFLRMLFKRRRIVKEILPKTRIPLARAKESYIRQVPKRIDEEKESILKVCPHCQNKLSKKTTSYQRTIEDIPGFEEQRVKITRYTINRYYCKNCKKLVSAKPLEVLPKCRLGINTFLYVLYSKYRLRLTQDLIQENLKTYFNLKIKNRKFTFEVGHLQF